jgi:hypothetical protein
LHSDHDRAWNHVDDDDDDEGRQMKDDLEGPIAIRVSAQRIHFPSQFGIPKRRMEESYNWTVKIVSAYPTWHSRPPSEGNYNN